MRKMLVKGRVREVCGEPFKGDPSRPCLRKPGHVNSSHRDAAAMQRETDSETLRRVAKLEEIRAYDRARGRTETRLGVARLHKLRTRTLPSAEGYVYALTSPWVPSGLVKIGSTVDLTGNLKSARRYLPGAEHSRVYPGGQLVEIRYLHKVFAEQRHANEWFQVDPQDIDHAMQALYFVLNGVTSVGATVFSN